MDISTRIKQAVPVIVHNFRNENSKTLLDNLIREVTAQVSLRCEQLYLAYNLVQVLSKLSEDEVVSFFRTVLPIPLSHSARIFMEQIVSLSVTLEKSPILTATAVYLQEEISFPPDLESLPHDLAAQSPQFAAVLISRGCFTTASPHVFSPDLVSKWLNHLTQCDTQITIDAQKVIEYSLVGQGMDHMPLHLSILQSLQKRKVRPITEKFILDIGSAVAALDASHLTPACDKLSQILLLVFEYKLLPELTESVRQKLEKLFIGNEFMRLVLKSFGK
jgi:hypothetical protein